MNFCSELNERERRVLMFVVNDFIQHGEAVSSAAVARSPTVDVSSATIRNVMHGLEERGLLFQPHTSAGRVPTAEGLREYVALLSSASPRSDRLVLDFPLANTDHDIEQSARQASGVLSRISHLAGLVMGPELSQVRLKDLRLILLSLDRVLAVLVLEDGGRIERVCELEEPVDSVTLQRMQNYLGDLAQGHSLVELRASMRAKIAEDVQSYQTRALKLGVQLAQDDEPTRLHVEGLLNLLEIDEFASDVTKLKDLVHTIEERERLLLLLEKIWDVREPVALIGPDLGEGFDKDLGLVVCGFYQGAEPLGLVGVLGPMRMDYSRMIPLVDKVARVLSRDLRG